MCIGTDILPEITIHRQQLVHTIHVVEGKLVVVSQNTTWQHGECHFSQFLVHNRNVLIHHALANIVGVGPIRENAKICKNQLGIVMWLASMGGLGVLQHDAGKQHSVECRDDFRDILSSEVQVIILDLQHTATKPSRVTTWGKNTPKFQEQHYNKVQTEQTICWNGHWCKIFYEANK